MWLVVLGLGILYIVNLISCISLIFVDKKDTDTTLAWLLIFMFIPIVAFILYFFFGSKSKYKLLSKKYSLATLNKMYDLFVDENHDDLEKNRIAFNDEDIYNYISVIEMNNQNAQGIYTQDNNVLLLTTAKQKFEIMFREIEDAKESVNVLYFIIKSRDEIGKKFLALLEKKAKEGVEVRVIYDMFGFLKTRRKDFKNLEKAGGMVYTFLPTLWRTIMNANYRMHRKMVVIDGKIAYTGGINIGDDYLGLDPVKTPWRDTAIRLTGSCVKAIQYRFLSDWAYLDKQLAERNSYASKIDDEKHLHMYLNKEPYDTGRDGVQILSGGPDCDYDTIRDSYVKMINSAKDYIYIQTPYISLDETVANALRIASKSGVNVKIMIPGIPDKKYVYYVTLSHVEDLLENGIEVYKHKGFIHAKTMVADDCIASIGTANLDIRSFSINYEINTMVYGKKIGTECRNTFLKDMNDCEQIMLEKYKERSLWQKILEGFCRLVKPLV